MLAEHLDKLCKWEDGELNKADTIKLFQYLVDTGDAYALQGCYGREATRLITLGLVKRRRTKGKNKRKNK